MQCIKAGMSRVFWGAIWRQLKSLIMTLLWDASSSLLPWQHFLGLVCQYGVVCFDHDSKSWCDSSFKQPFHSLLNKVLLVLRKESIWRVYKLQMRYISCCTYVNSYIVVCIIVPFHLYFYLGVLLRNMLFWELGQLNQLRYNFLFLIAVGAINQGASYCIQNCLILGLKTQRKERGYF